MSIWLLLTLIIAPAICWIGYFYYHDRFKPEPLVMTAFAYFLGFLSGWACLRAYSLLTGIGVPYDPEPLYGLNLKFLGYCLGPVGLMEELCKLLPFLIIIRFKDFDERMDGIFYSSAIALGFASFENVGYLPTLNGFFLFGRAVASPLVHTIFASIWGYYVGLTRIERKPVLPALGIGLVLASLGHGLYDFFTFLPLLRVISALLVLAVWIWRIHVSELLARSDRTRAQYSRKRK